MSKFSEFLTGIKILEGVESPYNGKITVVKSIAFGTYFQVDGLTQSGGIIKRIWNKVLGKLKNQGTKELKNVLILGLGGGSIVEVVRKYWPEAEITAVDIDPEIVRLGKKYLGLSEKEIKIEIKDAEDFLTKELKNLRTKELKNKRTEKQKTKKSPTNYKLQPTTLFDLILIDLYRGDEFPAKFETKNYIHLVRQHLTSGGVAVFNRLYYGDKRPQSVKFGQMLEKEFSEVDVVYPEANVMFVCYR